ncbi:snare-complex protein syntaxin-18 N-terminus-domain-containing protein [Pilaira anomala]|nr:snare-complex protein syntaxin-18 N-terminus-domain-containing protein [Pilaira anomala]
MSNITIEFRHLVEKKASNVPHKPNKKRRERHEEESYDIFTKEAYRIYQHIDSLRRFLLTIRPAYLSTSNRPSRLNARPTKASEPTLEGDSLFALFSNNIHNLTDRERDEIDFQAKLIIRRCMDRMKELETSEKLRQQREASKASHILAQFFSSGTEDVLFVHRSSITWLLNQQLMKVSQIQKDQQEIRLMREIEKSENQLSKSTYNQPVVFESQQDMPVVAAVVEEEEEENPFEQQLSQEQVQMLEKENSVMLEELNNTLNQVKSAEKALLEISTLQTQLTNHLAAQTAQTDKLYADAIATTGRVEQGNLQLLTAKERNKSSRKFMLVFLIMASFVLLFLDWYS